MLKTEERLEYGQLLDEFLLGCKTDQRIGMEFERIPVSIYGKNVVPYEGEYGVCELLREFAKVDNWDYILDGEEIIGLKKLHDTITLEPGCQFELSLEPEKYIKDLKSKIESIDSALAPILDDFDIKLLGVGVSPKTTYKNIKLIPKKRYHLMAKYLWGILSDVMMRETAGIQVGIDFKSEVDAMKKFFVGKTANRNVARRIFFKLLHGANHVRRTQRIHSAEQVHGVREKQIVAAQKQNVFAARKVKTAVERLRLFNIRTRRNQRDFFYSTRLVGKCVRCRQWSRRQSESAQNL